MDFEPVRVGVIGAGDISKVYLNGLVRSPAVTLQAIASKGGKSAQAAAAQYDAMAVGVTDLIADPAIELVVNLAPGKVHEDINAADYRGVGLIELALAIRTGRQHRTAPDFVVHCVDVMESIAASAREGQPKRPQTTCTRPPLLDPIADADLISLARSPFDEFAAQ